MLLGLCAMRSCAYSVGADRLRKVLELKVAAILMLILILPIFGPILYFAFRRPEIDAEAALQAQNQQRYEAQQRPIGGTGRF